MREYHIAQINIYALWWISAGHLPTAEEGKERLDYLQQHDETSYAFSFKYVFPEPGGS